MPAIHVCLLRSGERDATVCEQVCRARRGQWISEAPQQAFVPLPPRTAADAIMNAVPAMALCLYGFLRPDVWGGVCFGAGLGITLFGISYM